MQFASEQLMVQAEAKRYAREFVAKRASTWTQNKLIPPNDIRDVGSLGFLGMLVPAQWGGSEVGALAYTLAIEEFAAVDASYSTIVSIHNSVICNLIATSGDEHQKEKFLKPLAGGDDLGCFCLTEANAGSDASNISSTAVKSGTNYEINGGKQFISYGKSATIAIVFASTNKDAGKAGISAFIVPTDIPGYKVVRVENKMGQDAAETVQLVFENMVVPEENLIGKEGEGYKIALSNLACGRVGIAAQCVGIAKHALALALQYSKERKSFNTNIIKHQAVAFRLADMVTQLDAARALVWHAASMYDQGKPSLRLAAEAKLFASETAEKICSLALQTFGGYGYLKDYAIEQLYRDIRVTSLYEGTSDIQKIIISRDLELHGIND